MRSPDHRFVRLLIVFAVLGAGVGSVEAQEQTVPAGFACDGADETSVLRGAVLDLLTGNPLPGTTITLRSDRFGTMLLGVTQSDSNGLYVFCRVPPIPGLTLRADAEGVGSGVLELPDPPVGDMEPLYIEWSAPVDIMGQVIDMASGTPLAGARVTLPDRGARSTSNADGEFRIQGQGAGRIVLSTTLIGYASRVDTLDTVSGDQLDLTVRLATQPIELEPIEVRVRATQVEEARTVGSRLDQMTMAEIDSVLPRTIDFEGLLRAARFPGLTVRMTPDGSLCIAQTRRATGCAMAEVYLNGVRMIEAGMMLTTLDPNSIESLQFLDPLEAWTRFIGPNVQNGVLVIQTRSGRRPGRPPGLEEL